MSLLNGAKPPLPALARLRSDSDFILPPPHSGEEGQLALDGYRDTCVCGWWTQDNFRKWTVVLILKREFLAVLGSCLLLLGGTARAKHRWLYQHTRASSMPPAVQCSWPRAVLPSQAAGPLVRNELTLSCFPACPCAVALGHGSLYSLL